MRYGFFGGAGTLGTWIRKAIENNDSTMELVVIGDNNKKTIGQVIDDVKVVDANEFANYYHLGKIDMVVVAIDDLWLRLNPVIKQLSNLGIEKIHILAQYIVDERVECFDVRKSLIEIETRKPCMNGNLNIVTNRHCNLNCKGCVMYSNIVGKEYNMDFDSQKRDLIKIKEYFSAIRYVGLFGGEPLLNKQLKEYIVLVRELFPMAYINVETNGILLLSYDDEFYKMLADNNVSILITPYTINKENRERIRQRCEKFNVFCNLREDSLDDCNERSQFYKSLVLPKKEVDLVDSFKDCQKRGSWYNWHVYNGRMAGCSYPLYIDVFNEKYSNPIVVDEKDTIDIYQEGIDGYKILDFLNSPTPFCKYCAYEDEREEYKWEISREPKMEDWIIKGEQK